MTPSELTGGSTKQIAWATTLRNECLAELAAAAADASVRDDTARLLATRTHAQWWIEERHTPGADWPDLLGVGQPALAQPWDWEIGEHHAARIAAGMATAAQIRAVLDDAGIDRLSYTLRLHGDMELVAITLPHPAGAGSPEQDVAGRQRIGRVIVDTLTAAGWRLGSDREVVGRLAIGGLVRVWPDEPPPSPDRM